MTDKMRELCKIVGAEPELMQYNRMTTDEIIDENGKPTGIWYEDIEY